MRRVSMGAVISTRIFTLTRWWRARTADKVHIASRSKHRQETNSNILSLHVRSAPR
jgi:hypothetical protein